MANNKTPTAPKNPNEFPAYFNSQEFSKDIRTEEFIVEEEKTIAINFEEELDNQLVVTLGENRAFRKKYTPKIWRFTIIWTSFIGLVVVCSTINVPWWNGYNSKVNFTLSDSVLITLITTTTINAFGFFILVLKFLYSADHLKRTPQK